MQTVIHSSDFPVTEALNKFIQQSADKSMAACADRVERLVIRLKDINGPKGGADKECCVEVKVPNHPTIVVSKRSSDAYASIRKALARASRTTLRKLAKRREPRPHHQAIKTQSLIESHQAEAKKYSLQWTV